MRAQLPMQRDGNSKLFTKNKNINFPYKEQHRNDLAAGLPENTKHSKSLKTDYGYN